MAHPIIEQAAKANSERVAQAYLQMSEGAITTGEFLNYTLTMLNASEVAAWFQACMDDIETDQLIREGSL